MGFPVGEMLVAENERLAARLRTVEAERDAYLERVDEQVVWRQGEETRALLAEARVGAARFALEEIALHDVGEYCDEHCVAKMVERARAALAVSGNQP